VPLQLSDGSIYGALCGLSRNAAAHLDDRDVRFMSLMAEAMVEELDQQRRRERLRLDIERLIEAEDLQIAYQPIIDLHSGECLGMEALARFPAPFSRPDETFAAAEHVGLRLELERLAVSKAWSLIPQLAPRQFLALNVEPRTLLELAQRADERDDVPLSQVIVEITEHSAVESYTVMHHALDRLRRRGLRLAVDDAGAGYASLRHVLELRPDFIKVDRSLIGGIATDHARRVAVRAFQSMALDLGAQVVAEGVECLDDLHTVRELGLHAAQGYLLAKPSTDPDDLARWVGSQAAPLASSTRTRRAGRTQAAASAARRPGRVPAP
jgi:EAL domain-containing protein (putative c-di-GMP-specific phosphodiesterase class I)